MTLTKEQIDVATAEALKYRHVWENCETYGHKHHDVDLWNRVGKSIDTTMEWSCDRSVIVLGCGDGALVKLLDDL